MERLTGKLPGLMPSGRPKNIAARIAAFFMAVVMGFHMGTITSYADPPEWPSDVGIVAGAGIAVDADTGAVLFGQQIHVPYPPASIVKLLTALVVVENCSMDEIVTFSHDAVYNLEAGAGNKLSLAEGDQISVRDCLHMMVLLSSNQSANALAEHVAGSREGFVELMNQKAAQLGCSPEETHFANPSGLNDEQQYVSAYDMALIAAAAFENEEVFAISSTKRYSVGPTINNPQGANISMEHRIVMEESRGSEYYCEGAMAGKTGYTSLAGNTLVTYAERNGRRIISVILKGSDKYQYYMDAKNIMNFGFVSFKNEAVNGNETFLEEQEELELGGTTYPVSQLRLEDEAVTLPATAQFTDAARTLVTELPEGHPPAAVGILEYTYKDRKIGSAYIIDRKLETELANQAAVEASRAAEEASRAEEESRAAETATETEESQESGETTPASTEGKTGADRPGLLERIPWKSGQTMVLAVAAAAVAVVVLTAVLVFRKKRKERIAREQRRQRRRQRLEEIGYSEEDFEELMRQRRDSGGRRR